MHSGGCRNGGRWIRVLALFGICLLLVSCNKKDRFPQLQLVPTQGSIFINGRAASGAIVSFKCTTDLGEIGATGARVAHSGRVGDDGAFKVTTLEINDGIPVGYSYNIALTMPAPTVGKIGQLNMPAGPDMLENKYADAEKNAQSNPKFTFTVPKDAKGSFEIPRIELPIEGFWDKADAIKGKTDANLKERSDAIKGGQAEPEK